MGSLSINTNVQSLMAQNSLKQNTAALEQNQERLSTGLRINSAADDPAGLAISDRFTAQIKGQNQAVRNSENGISMAQTAEGGLQESTDILQRMREIAVQSANATQTDSDRESLNQEFKELRGELDRISKSTTFNGQNLLDGSLGKKDFQVGANAGENNRIQVDLGQDMRSSSIGEYRSGSVNLAHTSATDSSGTFSAAGFATSATLSATGALTSNELTVSTAEGDQATLNLDQYDETTSDGSSLGGDAPNKGRFQTSAYTVAQAINQSSGLDVNATASNEVTATNQTTATVSAKVSTGSQATASATYSLNINGVDITSLATTADNNGGGPATASLSVQAADLVDAINESKDETDVTAQVNGTGQLQLNSLEGGNIAVDEQFNVSGSGTNVTQNNGTAFFQSVTAANSSTTSFAVITSARGAISVGNSASITFNDSGGEQEFENFGSSATTRVDGFGNTDNAKLSGIDVTSQENARTAINRIDSAINDVDQFRGELGAAQNRFDSTIANLENSVQNLTESRSRIQDADIAKQSAEQTQNNIRRQASASVLAQANQNQQIALQLLGGG